MIPDPLFKNKLSKISWEKIYAREYGVQYSEMAILCLSPKAKYHISSPSISQVVIPDENRSAFYIDKTAWKNLIESLNVSYTSNLHKLQQYEKGFLQKGKQYVNISRKISKTNFKKMPDIRLISLYNRYKDALFAYSVFAWTSYILNIYISEKATSIIDTYIKREKLDHKRQDIIDSLFQPEKAAAILALQKSVGIYKGKVPTEKFNILYEKYKWLSCLDIHNDPWTKEEFRRNIKSFSTNTNKKMKPFHIYLKELKISKPDEAYLLMAKRFVYIKDARDDFRRKGVFLSSPLYKELTRRINIPFTLATYLTSNEILNSLAGKVKVSQKDVEKRKNGFVMYLNSHKQLVCLQGDCIQAALQLFHLLSERKVSRELSGMVASKGCVTGSVIIVKGVKDLQKVEEGNILVAVTTHPDYVPAMRKAAAIITDEGGITSHAAIVSREFGIPCIVGTKHASSLLKDGNKVEVDANKGKIKIIE